MRSLNIFFAILFLSVTVGLLAAGDKRPVVSAKVADRLLRDEPLTIVFRRISEGGRLDAPWRWSWSINSAGEGELTITSIKSTRRKVVLCAEQMAAIRKTLRDEQFVELKDAYGPVYIHGGWDTLTVIAGEHINKTVRYSSIWSWSTDRKKGTLTEAAPAARVWLKVTGIVDPDGKIFKEQKELAAALKALKK
jgi:hypothetical protein